MPSKRWIVQGQPHKRLQSVDETCGIGEGPKEGDIRNREMHFPAIYHCVSRVVDRRFVFGAREKDKFVEYMRMYESFAGIRILAFCVMSNHFHLMLEITRMPEGGLSDEELLNRLAIIYDEVTVEGVEIELQKARQAISEGRADQDRIRKIHARYIYRMHDLSEFMKSLIQRFTQWYNRRNERKGNLWEDAFRSTVVESGVAARMVATYIDLNPVRAGIVEDPADYPWCSYGEAVGGTLQRKKPTQASLRARAGLVRSFFAHKGIAPDARRWKDCHQIQRPWIEQAMHRLQAARGLVPHTADHRDTPGGALAGRIRHFTEGVAIGSRDFLEQFFKEKRDRFSATRKNGARQIRGRAARIAKQEGLCSIRDLQKDLVM